MAPEARIRITSQGILTVARRFRQVSGEAVKLQGVGRRLGSTLGKNIGGISSQMQGLYATLGGVGLAAGAKKIMDFGSSLGDLQARAKLTNREAFALRDQMLQTAKQFKADKGEVLSAAMQFQDYTGILKEGMSTIGELTRVHKATGASMKDLATIQAAAIASLDVSPQQAIRGLKILNEQANAGTISMEGLASVLPALLSSGKALGFAGERAFTQIGTALQVAGGIKESPEEARTMVAALFRDLVAKSKAIKGKLGVDIFDKEGNMRDLDAIMGEIAKKTKGRMTELAKFFTADSQLIAAGFAGQIELQTGEAKTGKTLAKSLAAGTTAEAAFEEQFTKKMTGVGKAAEDLKGAIATLDEGFQKHGANIINFIASDPTKAAALAGGGFLGLKLAPILGRSILGMLGRKRGPAAGGAAALGLPGGGVQPVFVVNMPGATLGQAASYFGGGGAAAPGAGGGKGKKIGALGALGRVSGALGAGVAAGTLIDQVFGISDFFGKMPKKAADKRVAAHGQKISKGALLDQARMFAQMAAKGKKGISQEIVMEKLRKQSATLGLSAEAFKELIPTLKKLTSTIAENPPTVTIKPAGGVESLEMKQRRGKQP